MSASNTRNSLLAALAAGITVLAQVTAATQSPTCRTYVTQQSGRVTGPSGVNGRLDQVCTPYNRSTNTVRCTLTHSYGSGANMVQVVTGYFKSPSDFVDEAGTTPPSMRMIRQDMAGQGSQSRLDFTYDSQNRPVKSVLSGSNGVQNSAFAGWDAAGRYTQVTITADAVPTELVTYTYDDKARTTTIANKRIPTTTVYTYDADGNLIDTVMKAPSGTTHIAVTIAGTDKICK